MKRKIFGILAIGCFFLVFGAVGAMEQGANGGMSRTIFTLAALFLCAWLAGAFEEDPQKENRQRECPPISGKRKAH